MTDAAADSLAGAYGHVPAEGRRARGSATCLYCGQAITLLRVEGSVPQRVYWADNDAGGLCPARSVPAGEGADDVAFACPVCGHVDPDLNVAIATTTAAARRAMESNARTLAELRRQGLISTIAITAACVVLAVNAVWLIVSILRGAALI